MPFGCLEQVEFCRSADVSTDVGKAICTEAGNMCRDNVEGIFENQQVYGYYDIRKSPKFSKAFMECLIP